MRLFCALWPDRTVREQIARQQRALVPEGGRPVHRDDLHLTLKFLGQVSRDQCASLLAIGQGIKAPSFQITLDHVGYFPRAQALWLGPSDGPSALSTFQQNLDACLQAQGAGDVTTDFVPHVTLARHVPSRPIVASADPVQWPVHEWGLIETLSGRVPRYRPIALWPLQ